MRYTTLACAMGLLSSGCSVLDQIELGTGRTPYDPTKIYLESDSFLVRRSEDLDRYVCLTGPLECHSWGLMWDCVCP